ncbi:hypothetical protein C7271_03905 [filamentous cyanobacterium CCP5]|nr:hypothetical protein C7271_03905 [filamentous cyanobacterium CCP5]
MADISKPQFSIVLPTYNRRHCIEKSIASVLRQSLSDYELLIVDDGSTDGTGSWLIKTYPPNKYSQIQIFILPENQGPAKARNVAIKSARGQWIAFIDSDDEWNLTFLEEHLRALQKHENAAMSACDAIASQLDNPDQAIHAESKVWSIYPNATHHMLMSSMIWSTSLVVINRHCLLKAGCFNEDLSMCEDRELYLRVLQLGEYIHVSKTLVQKNQAADSLTRNLRLYAREAIRTVDFFLDSPGGEPYRHLRKVAKSRWCMTVARMLQERRQDFWFAGFMVAQAIYYSPDLVGQAIQRRWKNRISDKSPLPKI